MIEASALLRSYLRVLRRVSGADCASLFVPASPTGSAPAMLLHDGESPLPELGDLDAALRFHDSSGGSAAVVPSRDPSGALVPLPAAQRDWARLDGTRRRRRTDPHREAPPGPPAAWLAVRFPSGSAAGTRLPPEGFPPGGTAEEKAAWWWQWLLALGGEIAGHAVQVSVVLRDPVTGVPGRAAFQGVLAEEIEKARARGRPLALLLVNPDDFAAVNQRFGRERGDEIIRELVARLRAALRSGDLVAKYGGVIYGAVLLDTPVEVAREVAGKVLQAMAEPAYQDGTAPLRFSIGVAPFATDDEDVRQPLDLIRRADQALSAAKRAGGGKVALWEPRWHGEGVGHHDRLTGIFTGNMASDYRNMVLLWDAVSVMAGSDDFETIAGHVVEKLFSAFEPERVALLAREGGASRLVAGLGRDAGQENPRRLRDLALGEKQKAFLATAARDNRRSASVFVGPGPSGEESYGYHVPLVAREEPLGGLYLDGPTPLDSADLIFLEALAAQLAVALDRARTAEDERLRQRQEQSRLEAELDGLREALQRAKLEYRSPQMEDVLSLARRVAPTEATVLIMGESGTGKELLARTIHELSPRRHKSLVVVDCSAIAPGLADNELFGHERGAYTGAQEGRPGRLAEANGGTLLLDEIGELPLEVQSKLLRFVQEKQLTTVGGSRLRGLDVRILAATNRELEREVAEGRFRGDLYHRLHVVKLVVPPLRDRPEDVLYLARHFLATYAAVYRKKVTRLAAESEALLLSHRWPGNVRELQNRVMQAVILCEGKELGPAELGLPDRATGAVEAGDEAPRPPAVVDPAVPVWERLRASLSRQIEQALAGPTPRPWPLGRWLAADAALEAARAADGVSRRAALRLGVPETTFRRLHRRASEEADAGLAGRSPGWEDVRRALQAVVAEANTEDESRLDRLDALLLKEVLSRTPDSALAASLMGVSLPTLRQRIDALREPPAAV